MSPRVALNVWQSMESELSCIGWMVLFGGLLVVALFTVANSRLYRILKAVREGNAILTKIAERDSSAGAASRTVRGPSHSATLRAGSPIGMTIIKGGATPPPLPTDEVYRL